MSTPVRVRFAPSPTGYLHVGGARSALFDFLFARHNKGAFVLRIEDTDRERLVDGSIQQITDSLSWLGLTPDEGPDHPVAEFAPYIQSERLKLYHQYSEQLLNSSLLYKDYSSSERLAELRTAAQKEKRAFRFTKEMAQLEPVGDEPYVLRFAVQPGADITWKDGVWGDQSVSRDAVDDFVAIKSDGFPTYHFASVVDDHLMKISHVIRGAEWIPSTPKHILLYEAFDWELPTFAHLPQVLGQDKAKLSKRHGAQSVLEYREQGYLPEALINFLASLGFNDGTTQDIYTIDELTKAFSLDRIQSSPAVFDSDRLDWMNGMYIRELSVDELATRAQDFWSPAGKKSDDAYKKQILPLIQERLKVLSELPELTEFFFTDPKVDRNLLEKNFDSMRAKELLEAVKATLEASDFTETDLETRLRALTEKEDVKTGQLFGLIRVAITGRTAAPGLFETLHTLGKDATLRRLNI